MFYKKKYLELLKENKELKKRLELIAQNNVDRQWEMLCKIDKLGKEIDKLEKENRQFRESSNTKTNA